jgi:hypothetical protein
LETPCLEKTHHKKGLVWLKVGVGPEFKAHTIKKKKQDLFYLPVIKYTLIVLGAFALVFQNVYAML